MSRTEKVLLFAFLMLSVLGMATAYLLLDGLDYQSASAESGFRVAVPQSVDLERQQVLDRMEVHSFEIKSSDAALLQALSELYAGQAVLTRSWAGLSSSVLTENRERYGENVSRYRKLVQEYIDEHGVERYIRLGLFTRGVFLNALHRVTEHLSISGQPVALEEAEFLARAVPTIEKLMGGYLDWAVQSGFALSAGSEASVHFFAAGLMYKLNWLQWLGSAHPIESYLTGFEGQALLANRVEFEPGLEPRERQKLLRKLQKHSPGYPIDVMRIVTLAKFGQVEDALSLLEEALTVAPDNLMLLRLKSIVERRAKYERKRMAAPPPNEGGKPGVRSGDSPTLNGSASP